MHREKDLGKPSDEGSEGGFLDSAINTPRKQVLSFFIPSHMSKCYSIGSCVEKKKKEKEKNNNSLIVEIIRPFKG